MHRDYDIIIIGAGMVGASLACFLAPLGLKIVIVEPVALSNTSETSYDDRGLTLSPSSERILDYINVWSQIQKVAFPIKNIHVSEKGRFGFVHFNAEEFGRSCLGSIVVARLLGQSLYKKMAEFTNIHFYCPAKLESFQQIENNMQVNILKSGKIETISGGLLVGADGGGSLVRTLASIETKKFDFKQTAIVANVSTQKPNNATAFERFTHHGPIALLPIGEKKSVLVFTVDSCNAEYFLSLSDDLFLNEVEKEFGRRLGKFEQIGKRTSYPLIYNEAIKQYKNQLVLLGNSAHVIHPNTAQGFNLGLRDVAGLAECIQNGLKNGCDIGNQSILEEYMSLRRQDQKNVITSTSYLAKLFYNKNPMLALIRNSAMFAVNSFPDLKTSLAEKKMGLYGIQPKIVRGLKL